MLYCQSSAQKGIQYAQCYAHTYCNYIILLATLEKLGGLQTDMLLLCYAAVLLYLLIMLNIMLMRKFVPHGIIYHIDMITMSQNLS